jgi:hypothetical protein
MPEHFAQLSHASWYRVTTLRCYCGHVIANDGPPLVCPTCGSAFMFEFKGPITNVTGIDASSSGDTEAN